MEDELTYNMYTFESADGKVIAAARLDSRGDLFVQMRPKGRFTEAQMRRLFERLGFRESLAPLKDQVAKRPDFS